MLSSGLRWGQLQTSSPASEVIPKKLVDKIRSGKFIEMKELLQDNFALAAQIEEHLHFKLSELPIPVCVRSPLSQLGVTAFWGTQPQ